MPLLSAADQQELRASFAAMETPVTVVFVTQTIGCESCVDARHILNEVLTLTDKVTVEEVNLVLDKERAAQYGIDRAPGLALLAGEERADTRIRFLGSPDGWDFLALVDAIQAVSGISPQALSQDTHAQLAALTEPLTLRVFVTPTCPHCPRAAALANRMAFHSPLVTSVVVQATEFYDLSRQYRVSGVPKTVGSNGREVLGALPEPQFVEALLGEPARDVV
jgi:glutaredoxin-like protein